MKAFFMGLFFAIAGILLVVASPFVTYYLSNHVVLGRFHIWIYLGFLPFAVAIMGIGFLIMLAKMEKTT